MNSRFRAQAMCAFILMISLWLIPAPVCAADEQAPPPGSELPIEQALALGILEGITEYLPVSSTGHLVILQHWMGRKESEAEKEAADALAICIQSGAILAVVLLYYQRLIQMARGLFGADPDGRRLLINLIIAFAPSAVIGILFGKIIKDRLMNIYSVTISMAVGAIVILAISRRLSEENAAREKDMLDMSRGDAFLVGCFQCLAFWPGFSRSLATILGCRLSKLRMSAAVEFSFLLGLITLSAATAKEGLSHGKQIIEHYGITPSAVALIAAFVSAVISVKFMVAFLNRLGLTPFAYYRLLLAALCLYLW